MYIIKTDIFCEIIAEIIETLLFLTKGSFDDYRHRDRKDKSCAVAKMTARCALYMSALKVSETSMGPP